jgi:hypothetical protein
MCPAAHWVCRHLLLIGLSLPGGAMRRAITLLEVLVAIAIVGLLIGLLLPAVQKVREAAAVVQSESQIRQIVLGMQHYGEVNEGKLPGCAEPHIGQGLLGTGALLPYVEQESVYRRVLADPSMAFGTLAPLRLFQNPLDPSRGTGNLKLGWGSPDELGVSGYALNAQALGDRPTISSATDGLSQTIWIAEHYAWNCGGTTFFYSGGLGSSWLAQPATFAHGGAIIGRPAPADYFPITTGVPPLSRAAEGKTFQIRPRVAECDPRLPNASSTRGLQVAFGDGSVRIIGRNVAPEVFWSAVTPSGSESVELP